MGRRRPFSPNAENKRLQTQNDELRLLLRRTQEQVRSAMEEVSRLRQYVETLEWIASQDEIVSKLRTVGTDG